MYVGIPKTRTTHHLLFFGKGLFEFGLDEGAHFSQLKIDNALFQTGRVPKSEADALAVHFRLDVR
jgi:hypothetical protein